MAEVESGMLAHYDRARGILQRALESSRVEMVLASRDELGHIKLHARQVRDRDLLADAFEFQMRVERRLGVLLIEAEAAGQLRRRGQRSAINALEGPARLSEIGVDARLSAKAKRSAVLDDASFETAISEVRATIAAGRTKLATTIDDANRQGEKRAIRTEKGDGNPFKFHLSDGTPIGCVKIGKLRSRIDVLTIELKILAAINERVGATTDALTEIADSISKAALAKIIMAATAE